MTAPVSSWTPSESWLFAAAVTRALVVRCDGGPPLRASPDDRSAPVRATLRQRGEHDVVVELTIDARRAEVSLDPPPDTPYPWRTAWLVELARKGDSSWFLTPGATPVSIERARRAAFTLELRWQERELVRSLAGEELVVPIVDAAFHRHTRQSSRVEPPANQLSWMVATQVEDAPWWEVDLGRGMYLASLALRLKAPPGTRVDIQCYGFATPAQKPPTSAPRHQVAIDGLPIEADGSVRITWDAGVVARVVRVSLRAAGPVSLAVSALELWVAALHEGTLTESMRRSFALFAHRPLLLARGPDGAYAPALDYAAVWSRSQALARGLAARLEDGKGDRIFLAAVLASRIEWLIAELAALARGYVFVPLSPDDSDQRLAEVLARARPACVITGAGDAERLARLCPARLIVSCDGAAGPPDRSVSLDALLAEGAAATVRPPAPRGDDEVWTVLFTSGSTGAPKGAMRSFHTFRAMIDSFQITQSTRHLSFQPLSHSSERMYLPALVLHGSAIAFSRGGAHVLGELGALAPEVMSSVPRLFEVVHAGYRRRLRAALAAEPDVPRAVIEARELAEVRRSFGDRLQALSVGSAPVSAELFAFLRRCFADVWVSEGYGTTEAGTIAFDGVIAGHVEVKLVPLPGAAAPAPGAAERGEIWVRTPHLITGYLGDPAASAAALDDAGFFATGDLGERDASGLVRVIGRLSSAVKLANGEFVSAETMELALGVAPIVDRIFVFAEAGAPAIAALVVPEPEALARLLGRSGDLAELAADPRAPELIAAALRAHGLRAGLQPYQLPRAVLVLGTPPTVEAGLLTASGKLARGAFAKRFGDQLAALAQRDEPCAADGAPDVETGDDDLVARVTRAVSAVVGRPVDLYEPLATAGIDSLAVAEILLRLSEALGRDVPHATWFGACDLATLAGALAEDVTPTSAGLAALASEDRARVFAVDPAATPPARTAPQRLVLTGATGFLGAHLLEALLARPALHVTCLVRARDDLAAHARVTEKLARWGIAPAPVDRLRVLAADLAAPGLGLTPARRDQLADETDAILHAGATVSWLAGYADLRAANVAGTLELLALASARRIKPLHFVSTISTAPPDGDEGSFLAFEEVVRGTPYGVSKWIAEAHVRRAAATLPVAIYRPAMIAGHSSRGHGNPDDFLHRYLAGVLELGRYLDLDDARIDFTPVDFVAAAIVALMCDQPLGGDTHHLVNVDQSPSYAGLGRALLAAGADVAPASYPQFRAALLHRRGRLSALTSFFPETGFALAMGPWPSQRSVTRLRALGIHRPPIDDAQIARYHQALLAQR